MLRWSVVVLLVALIGATLGFAGGLADGVLEAAKILGFVSLMLLIIGALMQLVGGRDTA